jgi:hypothetical protein
MTSPTVAMPLSKRRRPLAEAQAAVMAGFGHPSAS